MKRNTERILTTHVGSLPRPQEVVDLLFAQDRGETYDTTQFEQAMRRAVGDALRQQSEAGIDIVSDGEMSKISYATYLRHRLTGFEGDSPRPTPQDLDEYPEYRDRLVKAGHSATYRRPVCKGPIKMKDLNPLRQDIARMKDALSQTKVTEAFMNSASPGTIAVFQPNEYYASHETYLEALAIAMREEYEMIANSGLLLQLDCPDLAMGRHTRFKNLTDDQFLHNAELQVEALNHALASIPADRVRLHICWGNYEGSHVHDMDCMKIFPIALKAKPMALLVEAANPRHEHEWEAWTRHQIAGGQGTHPGRDWVQYQLRRAPGSGRAEVDSLREHLGARTSHGRDGLRIWHVCRFRRGLPRLLLDEDALTRRGCSARFEKALGTGWIGKLTLAGQPLSTRCTTQSRRIHPAARGAARIVLAMQARSSRHCFPDEDRIGAPRQPQVPPGSLLCRRSSARASFDRNSLAALPRVGCSPALEWAPALTSISARRASNHGGSSRLVPN